MLNYLRKVMRDAADRGASAVEYGLMVAAIAAVIVGIVFGLGTIVGNTFDGTCKSITGQGSATSATAKGCNDAGTGTGTGK